MSSPAVTSDRNAIPLPMLLTLALLAAIAPLAIDMYLPGLPELGDDLNASASLVQLTLTAFLLGLSAGQLDRKSVV